MRIWSRCVLGWVAIEVVDFVGVVLYFVSFLAEEIVYLKRDRYIPLGYRVRAHYYTRPSSRGYIRLRGYGGTCTCFVSFLVVMLEVTLISPVSV